MCRRLGATPSARVNFPVHHAAFVPMTSPAGAAHPQWHSTEAAIRLALLAILVVGLVGTEAELLLLKHTDGAWELVPVVLVGMALLLLGWHGVSRSAASLRGLQLMMAVFLASGVLGVALHFQGNVKYERDSSPALSGRELYRRAVMGATPMLAPGTMIQLGLVGLVFAFRHPSLAGPKRTGQPFSEGNES